MLSFYFVEVMDSPVKPWNDRNANPERDRSLISENVKENNHDIVVFIYLISFLKGVKNEKFEKMFWFGWRPQERAAFCDLVYLRNYTSCCSLADFML